MVKCPNCGGETRYVPKEKKVVCDYCNSKFKPEELHTIIKKSKEEEDKKLEAKSYSCSQCGATLLVFDDTAVTFCNYCGSNAMIESKLIKLMNPDYIIPFEISKEEAIKAYKNKINRSILVPRKLKSDITVEKFRGIYMPYCIYDMDYQGSVTSTGSVKYLHLLGYDYYNDYKVDANISAHYEGLPYDLASKYYDKFSMAIPFRFKEAKPFNINYISGYYADAKDVNIDTYDVDATKIISNDARNKLQHKKGGKFSSHGCSVPHIPMRIKERKIGLFPVYFLAIVNDHKKTVHYAVVNGQTGKVAMDMPIDYKKYLILSLLLSIPIYFLVSQGALLKPITVTWISIFFSLISFLLSNKQLNDLFRHQNHLDDKGFQMTKQERRKKMKLREKFFHYTWKQTLGIIICILAVMSGSIEDSLYYGSSLIAFFLVLCSFYDLIKEHNALSTSKLPQLEKRGGDSDA